jgi:crossover junction endodeoxyribonuclease RuvC
MTALRVLGIDPGSRLAGYGVVERDGSRLRHVDNGVVVLDPKAPLASRLVVLHRELTDLVARYRPEVAAFERIFFAKNAQSALVLGHARGVALLVAAASGLPVFEYTPAEVKRSISTSGKSDKHQVQQMVKFILGLPEPAQEDASDALAVAICHCNRAVAAAGLASAGPAAPGPAGGGRR